MKPIAIDEFCHFKFLSNITFSPSGKSLCFVASNADKKSNGYRSFIYMWKDGKIRKLTSGGKERTFQYLDEDTVLFPGMREEQQDAKEPDLTSRFYKIRLDGGEAELAYTFPIPVSQIMPLANGDLVVLGQTIPGFEELYRGDKKLTAEWKKYTKENADYEEIRQVPWWWNGGTYTKGAYQSLFYYDAKRKTLRRLTGRKESIDQAELSSDKSAVYYIASPVEPYLKLHGNAAIFRMKILFILSPYRFKLGRKPFIHSQPLLFRLRPNLFLFPHKVHSLNVRPLSHEQDEQYGNKQDGSGHRPCKHCPAADYVYAVPVLYVILQRVKIPVIACGIVLLDNPCTYWNAFFKYKTLA